MRQSSSCMAQGMTEFALETQILTRVITRQKRVIHFTS